MSEITPQDAERDIVCLREAAEIVKRRKSCWRWMAGGRDPVNDVVFYLEYMIGVIEKET